MGTWNMERDDPAQAVAALRAGLERGLTHVDTAELYGTGTVETLVGEAMAGKRDRLFLVSKVLPSHARREQVKAACEASLRRLRTDRLDCYLLHWPSEETPLEETLGAFEELRAAGKILSWGLSNFDAPELDQALAFAGEGKIACNQVLYHLRERGIEHAVLPWCERHGVAVVAYSPFGSTRLPGPRTPAGKVLAEIGEAHEVDPHAVALAFLVRKGPLFAIPKSSRSEHVRQNAPAGDLELSSGEISRLEGAFPRGPEPRTLPTL